MPILAVSVFEALEHGTTVLRREVFAQVLTAYRCLVVV